VLFFSRCQACVRRVRGLRLRDSESTQHVEAMLDLALSPQNDITSNGTDALTRSFFSPGPNDNGYQGRFLRFFSFFFQIIIYFLGCNSATSRKQVTSGPKKTTTDVVRRPSHLDASNDQQNGRVPSQHVPPPTLTHQITTETTVAAAAGEDKRGLSPWYIFFFLYIYTVLTFFYN
jgi:hypothetical protein